MEVQPECFSWVDSDKLDVSLYPCSHMCVHVFPSDVIMAELARGIFHTEMLGFFHMGIKMWVEQ